MVECIGAYISLPSLLKSFQMNNHQLEEFYDTKTLSLPTQFEGFRHILEQSAVEYMKVHAQREAPYITNSKLGGYPYLPKGASHPRDDTGNYMILLAQINFSEAAFPAPFLKTGYCKFSYRPSFINKPWERMVVYLQAF